MAAPRFAAPPPLNCTVRDSLPEDLRRELDTVVKQLKIVSRRLHSALQAHRDELQILERLYYKGKNQHRTALFWQRVAEMRKFGDRLQGTDMYTLVENVRLSFWGEPSARNSKILKGRWTHMPDAVSLAFVLKRCSECHELTEKTRERLLGSHRTFILMMQTGAFLQLILTLTAINSRLCILVDEISSTLFSCQSAIHKALNVIDPPKALSLKHLVKGNLKQPPSQARRVTPAPSQKKLSGEFGEDLGSTIQRQDTTVSEEHDLHLQAFDITMDLGIETVAEEVKAASTPAPPIIARTSVRRNIEVSSRSCDKPITKRKPAGPTKSDKPTKKKKKKDEIDDIFGF